MASARAKDIPSMPAPRDLTVTCRRSRLDRGTFTGRITGSRGSSPCSAHPQPDPVVLQSRHPADAGQHSSQQREA